jgi:hypothetical protein
MTVLTLPDWRVEGATPAKPARESGVGNRPRASPISASSRAARTAAGQAGEDHVVGMGFELFGDAVDHGLDLRVRSSQQRDQGPGWSPRAPARAGRPSRARPSDGVQHLRIDPAAVGHARLDGVSRSTAAEVRRPPVVALSPRAGARSVRLRAVAVRPGGRAGTAVDRARGDRLPGRGAHLRAAVPAARPAGPLALDRALGSWRRPRPTQKTCASPTGRSAARPAPRHP